MRKYVKLINIRQYITFLSYLFILLFGPLFILGLNAQAHNTLVQHVPALKSFGLYDSERQQVVAFVSSQTERLNISLSPSEYSHLNDLKQLVSESRTILTVLFTLSLIFLLFSWYMSNDQKLLLINWRRSIRFVAAFLLTLMLTAVTFFQSFFTTLHYIFFPAGNWLFDPSIDLIINIYPPEFFFYLFICFAIGVALMVAGLYFLLSWMIKKRLEPKL